MREDVAVTLGAIALVGTITALVLATAALRRTRRSAPPWMRRKLVATLNEVEVATDLLRRIRTEGCCDSQMYLRLRLDDFLGRRQPQAAEDEVLREELDDELETAPQR